MMKSSRVLIGSAMAAGLALALTVQLTMPRSLPRPAFVRVVVRGEPRLLPRGTTFDVAVRTFELWPKPGNLLSVQGQTLRPGVNPGYSTLDGHRQTGDPPLRDGQVLGVVDGHDKTEGVRHEVIAVPAGEPGNPQFFLGNAPGEQVVTRGAISGVVLSTVFRPTGPARRPPRVALTFDDGPWPTTTSAVLDILRQEGVRATFFDVGYLVREHPDLVRQELDAGMVVGNHSWDHPITPPFRDLPHPRITSEIRRTNTELVSFGARPQLFRPPGGSYSPWILREAQRQGVRVVLWSVDPRDWAPGATARHIVRSVLSHVRPGSIILLHDGGGDRSATVAALPRIIRGIQKMGLSFTVPRLAQP
jgi:peptidoglycan/xylan/chitin deacetylase (PgdA/CDA1 family)